MKILFFGDSITSAENNSFVGFVENLNLEDYINYGVSGTTIGDYSLYPVYENNLISLIKQNESQISEADMIFLEYGANDVSSITANYAAISQVKISLIKALDYLHQINPKLKIFFILLGANKKQIARGQCNYLNEIYFKKAGIKKIKVKSWLRIYRSLEHTIRALVPCLVLSENKLDESFFDDDQIHPNDAGYKEISISIIHQLDNLSIEYK